jgi:GNAT superfamily N-acetyltransferase
MNSPFWHQELADFKPEDELDLMFGYANPNLRRVGCPPLDVLIGVARHERRIGDPVYDHLGKCSPCYRTVRAILQAADGPTIKPTASDPAQRTALGSWDAGRSGSQTPPGEPAPHHRRSQRRGRTSLFDLFPEENSHYAAKFSIEAPCTVPREDPSEFTETIDGQIVRNAEFDDEPVARFEEEPVGTFVGYRLRRDLAFDARVPFFEIADAFSMETHDYLFEVFTEDGDCRPEIIDLFNGQEPGWDLVLMAHTLQIEPNHRGRCLGYAVMHAFIEAFGPGAGLVIIQAAPMNPPDLRPEDMKTPEYKSWRSRGVKKLHQYWRDFGFVATSPDSEYLVMNLELRRPTLVQAILRARARRARRRPSAGADPSGSSTH